MPGTPTAVAAWDQIVTSRDPLLLADLLAEDAVFRSPAVHTPQVGRAIATAYLTAAIVVLGPTLRYVRRWYAPTNAVLEFEAELDGLTIHGIDLLQWNEHDRVTEFTVMVRPFKGLQHLMTLMGQELQRQAEHPPA